MVNVALLSKWHVHADDYARQAMNHEQVSVKLVWDEDEQRGKKWAEKLGVPFEAHLTSVFRNEEIDAVIIETPTTQHKEVIIEAAKNKKHIFTEKVLALTVEDCNDIFEAVKENGVNLMVSLPRLTETDYLYAQEALDQGLLGKLTTIRCRLAHNGAVPIAEHPNGWLPKHFFNLLECGGGAFIDLGAHPIYLSNRLAGKVKAVTAKFQHTTDREVDDNAVAILEYDSGTLGIIETGFLSTGSPFQLELYGTEGTLLIEDSNIRLKSKKLDDVWIEPKKLPDPLPKPFEQWVKQIVSNENATLTYGDFLDLTLVNEAAMASNQEGRRIEVNEVLNN